MSDREALIECYVRTPEKLSSAALREVETILRSEPWARELESIFRDFYAAYDARRGSPREPDERVDRLVERLFPEPSAAPEGGILLHPVSEGDALWRAKAYEAEEPVRAPYDVRRFATVALLVSVHEGMLLHVYCDLEGDDCLLYLVSDDHRRRANAVVSFADLDRYVSLDDTGSAVIHKDMATTLSRLEARVYPVVAVFCRRKDELTAGANRERSPLQHEVVWQLNATRLDVQINRSGPDTPPARYVSLESNGERQVVRLVAERVRFDLLKDADALTLRLHA